MKPSKAVIAGAAVAGLLTGSLAVRAYAASTSSHAGVSLHTMAEEKKPLPSLLGQRRWTLHPRSAADAIHLCGGAAYRAKNPGRTGLS